MILHPFLSLPAQIGETPASFCSRVALKVGRSAREFADDIGITFQSIVDGVADSIALLAQVSGAEANAFEKSTLVRTDDRKYDLAGQAFTRETLTRGNVYVCPACLAEDLDGPDGRHGAYGPGALADRGHSRLSQARLPPRRHGPGHQPASRP